MQCWHEMEARLAGPNPSPDSDREKKIQQGTVLPQMIVKKLELLEH